jgi:hypothetical protein
MSETSLDKALRYFAQHTSLWKTSDEAISELAARRGRTGEINIK